MSVPPDKLREARGGTTSRGTELFNWQLTSPTLSDLVHLPLPPPYVLPVIFVPGIMGSNLKSKQYDDKVWLLDKGLGGKPMKVAYRWLFRSPGKRQKALHPDRVDVYDGGAVPTHVVGSISNASQYKDRGWGEVGQASYEDFLVWLEDRLNGQTFNPARWVEYSYSAVSATPAPGQRPPEPKLYPGISMQMRDLPNGSEKSPIAPILSDDLLHRAKFRMPVYACGYNWLASNEIAAQRLKDKINAIIAAHNRHGAKCEQVVLVTHSMGGLVARACQQLPGMPDKIAGIVHGVMPALGAAVAYRRCKVGMWDEDFAAGMAIGNDGQSVTAVFAQAPGALQLLPNREYRAQWLKVVDEKGRPLNLQPVNDPYDDIYLRRDRWWGLVRESWLRPKDGVPLSWDTYAKNVIIARNFHAKIKGKYHPSTYVYYGNDTGKKASFETVTWALRPGLRPDNHVPTPQAVARAGFDEVRDDGSNPVRVGGRTEYVRGSMYSIGTSYETSYWDLVSQKQDGRGDGTVPASSGKAPLSHGGGSIKQQFNLKGFGHEEAYRNRDAQYATLYSLMKIASMARLP